MQPLVARLQLIDGGLLPENAIESVQTLSFFLCGASLLYFIAAAIVTVK